MKSFSQSLAFLATEEGRRAILGMQRGIERETLRVDSSSHLATNPHSPKLGSALTHDRITTDYSESLLEFITPVYGKIPELLEDLSQTHAFTVKNIDQQYLWPVSMPCFVDDITSIPLAQYGSSNVGKMKTLYRKGLTARYGAQMQIIAGVHFNFSVSQELWQLLYSQADTDLSIDEFISDSYFGLIRNYRRTMWVLPYLFGASPALCGSFLEGLDSQLPFKKTGIGTLYLPYATSLRMSDLGYTNKEQENLGISYNSLDEYLCGMQQAIRKKSAEFAKIGVKVDGEFLQLNDNVLQIENEFYSPIRAKRVTQGEEKPSEALARAGVQYIEVRALDINPFSPIGITESQVRFLDLFLLYCLLTPSTVNSAQEDKEIANNLNAIILEGRKPDLHLQRAGESILRAEWLHDIFNELQELAQLLDSDNSDCAYQNALAEWQTTIDEPSKTLSGRMLEHFVPDDRDHGAWALELAKSYQQYFQSYSLSSETCKEYEQQAQFSLLAQEKIEASSTMPFDEYLADYFKDICHG